jgi:hypothetical protein
MVVGPIEKLTLRLEQLEAKLGKPALERRQRAGKATAADRWLSERLDPTHPELIVPFAALVDSTLFFLASLALRGRSDAYGDREGALTS